MRKGNTLEITVKGGCQKNNFKLIWDGSIMESYPMRINLVLTSDRESPDCQDTDLFTLTSDLSTLLGNSARLEEYHFNVSNGSAIQDVGLSGDTMVSDN